MFLAAWITMAACLLVGCGESAPSRDVWEEALSAKNTGLAYLYRNDLEGAAGSFESVVRLVPREPLGHANRALAMLKLQDYEQAAASVDRAVDLAPEDGEVLSIKSDIVAARGDREAALGLLAHAVGHNASDVVLRYKYLTEMRRQRGPDLQEEDALAELQAMLEYEPDNLAVLVELNEILVRLGRSREASAGYRRMSGLLQPVPEDIQTWLDRTLDALDRRDGAEAESSAGILGNLLVVDPAYRASRDRLGDPSQQSPPLYDFRTAPPDLAAVIADSLVDMAFVDAGDEWMDHMLPDEERWTDLALADVDGDGRLDLALAGLHGMTVLRNRMDGWEADLSPWSGRDVSIPGPGDTVFQLIPGDFDNDGDMDILAAGTSSTQVYRNEGDGTFGLAQTLDPGESPGLFVSVSRADFDHDGDLDVLASKRSALRFYRHTEGGVFDEATSATGFLVSASGAPGMIAEGVIAEGVTADGVAADGVADVRPAQSLAWGDFDLDGAVDVVALSGDGALRLYRNLRQGRWVDWTERFGGIRWGGAKTVAAADFNNDGVLDLFMAGTAAEGCRLLWNDSGRRFNGEDTPPTFGDACEGLDAAAVRPFDFDNDGFIDLALAGDSVPGRPGLRLVRNLGNGTFEERADLLPGLPSAIEDVEVGDLDDDGDLDLVLLSDGRPLVLRNDGGNANGWLKVQLAAALEGSGKNNFYGIGSTIEINAGSHYQSLLVDAAVTHVGLGSNEQADVIRVIWSNGVPQNRIGPESRTLIVEPQRLKGSCPSLYTWNGDRFVFVTHLMTRSAIGALTETGAPAWPDAANDYVKIRGDQLRMRDGKFEVRVVEELWDAVYMDKMELLVVDHPAETDIFVDEKYLPPPYPDLEIHTVTDPRLPVAARDHHGNDILPALAARDSLYVGDYRLGDFQGVPETHSITLDLGDLKSAERIHLYLCGWIMPIEPSSNLALSQRNNVAVIPPYLEVPDGRGQWRAVIPYTGFPSGEHKTVFIDLTDRFPAEDYRVRLTTNLELYWSEAFFTVDEPVRAERRINRLSPDTADLHYRGYSREYRTAPYGPFIRDYQVLSGEPQWLPFAGYRTRYGDVTPLLRASDNRYVIYSSGEEIKVTFDAADLPAPPPGWTRNFVLHTDGWLKEGDLNTATAATIEPLPFHGMAGYPYGPESRYPDEAALRAYRKAYNTRWVSQERFREALRLHGPGSLRNSAPALP
ncbi:MAG: FG-GAP-like repeat-containing protein [candidate division Zixibacteria bacterium]|nr:FG-GAP-like repeat-containing protein [candidate division Zixibacteria bacterium]